MGYERKERNEDCFCCYHPEVVCTRTYSTWSVSSSTWMMMMSIIVMMMVDDNDNDGDDEYSSDDVGKKFYISLSIVYIKFRPLDQTGASE